MNAIQIIAVYAIPVLLAISLHEAAHGYTARYFGDPTAAGLGRLSLNPARHIDPFGTILLPLILYLTIQIPFGYAKPVPVDFNRLRNPKKQMGWVALAGPAANFFMGLMWALLLTVLQGASSDAELARFLTRMASAGVIINAAMIVFNLLPVPPLDGGRIVTALLPQPLSRRFARIEAYSLAMFIVLIGLSYFGVLNGLLTPPIYVVLQFLMLLVSPITYFL